jgi:hypothetical protein
MIIIIFVLLNILDIINILGIKNNYITIRLAIKINRFFIIGIRGYFVSVLFNIFPRVIDFLRFLDLFRNIIKKEENL